MRKFCSIVAAGAALLACEPSAEDARKALQHDLETGRANMADEACGFTTFGLANPTITNFKAANGSGSATISGTSKEGVKKGTACTGNITFNYVKGRSTTQGVNGESVSYVCVITNVKKAP